MGTASSYPGSGSGVDADARVRITALEDTYVRTTRFFIVSGGTSGTITIPPNSQVVLNDFGGTVDAVITGAASARPDGITQIAANGNVIATDFDASGNYLLTETAASYPVALVYRVQTKLVNFDSASTDIVGPIQKVSAWGSITGTLANQDDLASALASRENTLTFTSPLSRLVDTISIPAASGVADGYLSTGAQNIGGEKTFINKIILAVTVAATTTAGTIFKAASLWMHDMSAAATNGRNTFLGIDAGNLTISKNAAITDGSELTGLGYNALKSVTYGKNNTCLGSLAGTAITTASNSVIVGDNAGKALTTEIQNTAVGSESMLTSTGTTQSTALGYQAAKILTGASNTAIGYQAMVSTTSGTNNTSIGLQSLRQNVSGSFNTALGDKSGDASTGANNIFVGFSAGRYSTESSSFYVNAFNRTDTAGDKAKSIIYGLMNATETSQTLRFNAKVGVFTAPTLDVELGALSARTLGMTRHTTANTAGNSLTISAGSSTTGATDKAGGKLILAPGVSTGTAITYVPIMCSERAGATATADNAQFEAIIAMPPKLMTDNVAVGIFELALVANSMGGGSFFYSAESTNGTDFQSHTGVVVWSAVNKAGVITATIGHSSGVGGLEVDAASEGSLSDTWTIVAGASKVTITANLNSSLAAPVIRTFGTIINQSNKAITLL